MGITTDEKRTLDDLDKEITGLKRNRRGALKLGTVLDREISALEVALGQGDADDAKPKIDKVSVSALDLEVTEPVFTLIGRDFLAGKAQALLTVGTGTASLAFTARRPGTAGNDISVAVIDSESGGLAVSISGTDIEIDLGGDTPTAATVRTSLIADADINRLVAVATSGGGGGTLLVAAQNWLAGGTGTGFVVLVNGEAQAVDATISATSVAVVCDNLTTPSDGAMVTVLVQSNGVWSNEVELVADHSDILSIRKRKKIAVGTGNNTEVDSAWDLPADAIVHAVWVEVNTGEAGGTLDVGLLSSESGGDLDGFIDGIDVSAAGIQKPVFAATVGSNNTYVGVAGAPHTRGALLTELLIAGQDVADAGDGVVVPGEHIAGSVTSKSVSYKRSGTFTTLAAVIWIEYSVHAG